ncbi:hypothetical protein AC844P1_00029 [Anaerostipes phage AC844P1]|nr:hypothetical protein AC844P1_00029 [Anaerostipes phage AC844P1]WAX05299.1 hypothetical protein AC844P2_00029 [Anaerostipes phage AC844P2]WAX05358.1 hypothetical protein AC844P3_00029 [Anaerostipes phage AC844P3]
MEIGERQLKEIQVISLEDELLISITDDDVIEKDGFRVVCVPIDS